MLSSNTNQEDRPKVTHVIPMFEDAYAVEHQARWKMMNNDKELHKKHV